MRRYSGVSALKARWRAVVRAVIRTVTVARCAPGERFATGLTGVVRHENELCSGDAYRAAARYTADEFDTSLSATSRRGIRHFPKACSEALSGTPMPLSPHLIVVEYLLRPIRHRRLATARLVLGVVRERRVYYVSNSCSVKTPSRRAQLAYSAHLLPLSVQLAPQAAPVRCQRPRSARHTGGLPDITLDNVARSSVRGSGRSRNDHSGIIVSDISGKSHRSCGASRRAFDRMNEAMQDSTGEGTPQ